MTLDEAWQFFHEYYHAAASDEIDENAFVEASENIIRYGDYDNHEIAVVLFNLASFYYEHEEYEMALENYRMLYEKFPDDIDAAFACCSIAKIMMYGLYGVPDYEGAHDWAVKACEIDSDNLVAACVRLYTLMLMDSDYIYTDKYADEVFELYKRIKNQEVPGVWVIPVPEIELILAMLFMGVGEEQQAKKLLLSARRYLFNRLLSSRFPDDLYLMEEIEGLTPADNTEDWEIRDIYDLFSMYEFFSVSFIYNDEVYMVVCDEDRIMFEGEIYKSPMDFFLHATIDDVHIYRIADKLEELEPFILKTDDE